MAFKSVETFEQKGARVEAIQVHAMRRVVTRGTPRWQDALPPWLADAIGSGIIGICWERTHVAIAGDGVAGAAEDDWIVRMPDGTLTVYTDAAFLALYKVNAPVVPAWPGVTYGGIVTFTDISGNPIPVAGQCPTCGIITANGTPGYGWGV